MKDRHWTTLVSSLRSGKCVLVLGPEIPVDTPGPTGLTTCADALCDRLAQELRDDNKDVNATSLAGIAQHYEDAQGFGSGALRSQTANFYASAPFEPSAVHRALAALPFPLILTTSHDRLMQDALTGAGKQPVPYRYHLRGAPSENPEFVASGSAATPILYYLFGMLDEPESLVISENDLLDFLIGIVKRQPELPNRLTRELQRDGVTMLFVGFGIRHWYLRVLLKALIRVLPGRSSNAVAVEPLFDAIDDSDRKQTVLFYSRGARVEVFDGDWLAFLGELQQRLSAGGGAAPSAAPMIGARPRVFLSYASEDNALASRLFASLQQQGFEPWFDKDGLRGGDRWDGVIEEQLRDAEYVLVLETRALAAKRVGYVNKEIATACEHAKSYRDSYLIPVLADDLPPDDQVDALNKYQRVPLRAATYDADVAALVSVMRRDYQRRQRRV